MDERRFDAIARTVGKSGSRRSLLKGLLGLAAGIATNPFVAGRTDAARRPAPTPKPPTCLGSQMPCPDGCCCPEGSTICGAECCPAGATCCDNACCYGVCLGEEDCCEPNCPYATCGLPDGCGGFCGCPGLVD